MKKQLNKNAISNFTNYKLNNPLTIFGGSGGGSTVGGDVDIKTNIKGGVLNASIGNGGAVNLATAKG